MATSNFTIADVLAWARTKPADESYDYASHNNCALCQFVKETGRVAFPSLGGNHGSGATLQDMRTWKTVGVIPDAICKAANPGLGEDAKTFGGLAKRLEALLLETPVTPSDWLKIDAYLTDIETVSA